MAFGGCKSSAKWQELGLWYPGDEPTEAECEYGRCKLDEYDWQVDYILTHKYEADPNGRNLSLPFHRLCVEIEKRVPYRKWYYGHYHKQEQMDERHEMIYDTLIPLT